MNTTEEVRVDVRKIMEDIQHEIETKGLFDDLPAFGQVSMFDFTVSTGSDTTGLRSRIQAAMDSCVVQADYPVTGSFAKKLFKKASQKATRCSVFPLSQRVTETNMSILQCLSFTANIIEQQQKQISDLNAKLADISKLLNGEVGN